MKKPDNNLPDLDKWIDKDPNHCGLDPLTTGKWDPFFNSGACSDHDLNMSEERKSPLGTALEFTVDALNTATINVAKAVYSVTFVVPYVVVGAIGGFFRDIYKRRGKE